MPDLLSLPHPSQIKWHAVYSKKQQKCIDGLLCTRGRGHTVINYVLSCLQPSSGWGRQGTEELLITKGYAVMDAFRRIPFHPPLTPPLALLSGSELAHGWVFQSGLCALWGQGQLTHLCFSLSLSCVWGALSLHGCWWTEWMSGQLLEEADSWASMAALNGFLVYTSAPLDWRDCQC